MENNTNQDPEFQTVIANAKYGVFKLIHSLIWLVKFSFSKWLIHLACMLVGFGIGVGLYSVSKPVYASTLTINNTRLKNDFCEELIGTLSSLKEDKANDISLSKKLSLSPSLISQIKSISYKSINDKVDRIYNDSLNYTLPFLIEVKVYDIKVLDSLQTGLIQYLESNEFVVKRKEIDKENLENFEKKIDKELIALDSFKLAIYSRPAMKNQASGGVSINESEDPSRINEVAVHMYQKKLDTHKKLLLNNSFEVITGFGFNIVPKGPNRSQLILICILIGYIVSLIFLLWKHINTKEN